MMPNGHYQMDPYKQTSMTFIAKYKYVNLRYFCGIMDISCRSQWVDWSVTWLIQNVSFAWLMPINRITITVEISSENMVHNLFMVNYWSIFSHTAVKKITVAVDLITVAPFTNMV